MLDASKPSGPSDRYLVLLSALLMAYAVAGKGVAYLGFPPFYVGEIVFVLGLAMLLRPRGLIAAMTTLPSLLLAVIMVWVLLRTLPFLDMHGMDALRDSVLIMYGGFAFIVIELLLADSRRIKTIVRYYGAFLTIAVPAIFFSFVLSRYFWDYIPKIPGRNIPMLWPGPGEVAVHLSGAVVFVLVGFRKVSLPWTILVFAALVMVSTSSRGAMLAFAVPVTLAALMTGKARELAGVCLAGLLALGAANLIESAISERRDPQSTSQRSLSTWQIIENAQSIIGQSGEQTEDTKMWRIQWWNKIIADTLHGPNFWSGRGFGLNLAIADGLEHGDNPDSPPLRSPHNVHMTVLARAGVPGAVMWGGLLASWLGLLTSAMFTARHHGQDEWAGLFLFVGCYVLAIVINATFDVALEAPMQGIWFWCLFGFGIGAVMIYRCQPKELVR